MDANKMSSVKTAQLAAEEAAEYFAHGKVWNKDSEENKRYQGFLAGVTWAKFHDPDVLALLSALEDILGTTEYSIYEEPHKFTADTALGNYRKSTEAK